MIAGGAAFTGLASLTPDSPRRTTQAPAPVPVAAAHGKLPLAFEPNAGRTDARVEFMARGAGYGLFLTRRAAVLALAGPPGKRGAVVRSRLLGARAADATGERRLSGVVHSYKSDATRTGIETYEGVRYAAVYPGIDLVYHGREGELEYDFEVRPGADPTQIAMRLSGAQPRLTARGDLQLATRAGAIAQRRPVAFQEVDGGRRPVRAGFRVSGHDVRFELGSYDRSRPLLIDPKVVFSTYHGGSGSDYGHDIAVDADGDAYITGATFSADFPTADPDQSGIGGNRDAFVTRINAAGTERVFSTYFGGTAEEISNGIALDGVGGVYITGSTKSNPFPSTDGSTHSTGASDDVFVAKYGADGIRVYSTVLGGATAGSDPQNTTAFDQGHAIAADAAGNAFVTGIANSTDFPTTGGTMARGGTVYSDAFVMKLAPGATTASPVRSYVTYITGNSADFGQGIALAGSGKVFVVGRTFSNDLPSAVNSNAGSYDGFIAKVNATGSGLDTSRYMGTANPDVLAAVEVDGSGNVYVGGGASAGYPATGSTVQPAPVGNLFGGFLAKLNSSLTPQYATYIAGNTSSSVADIALDSLGNLYAVGEIGADTLTIVNPLQSGRGGPGSQLDGFLVKLNASASAWVVSTYLGGPNTESMQAVSLGPNGAVYVTGYGEDGFPLVAPLQSSHQGGTYDAILLKVQPQAATIDGGPAGPTTSVNPSFEFSTTDSGTTFKCGVDGPDPPTTTCTSPKAFPGLAQGSHTFRVQAFDSGGSTDATVSTRTFFVDSVAPGAPALQEPADNAFVLSLQPSLQWSTASDPAPASGIARYDLVMDGNVAATVAPGDCGGGTCTAVPGAALSEGSHTWQVRAVDAAGNTTGSAVRTLTAATTPAASLVISPNPALAGRAVTFDGSGSDARGGTFTKFEWDLDGDGSFETDTGTATTATKTYGAPANLKVQLRVTTLTGQTAIADSALIVTDPTATSQFGVSINNGAQYTRTPDVTVTTTFPPSIRNLLFSNDGGFFAPTSFAAQRETKWKLETSGPERLPKIVYVRFMNGPITAQTLTDDIILDETPPVVQSATIAGPAKASVRSAAAKKRTFTLRIRARDSNSGVGRVQVTQNKRKPGRLLAYRTRLKVKATSRKLFVRARDRAGNFSKWRKAR